MARVAAGNMSWCNHPAAVRVLRGNVLKPQRLGVVK